MHWISSKHIIKYITSVAYIDLTAAYDTVNHRLLLKKLYHTTKDFKLTKVIGMLP